MTIYEHIRESRVFSYIMAAFSVYWLSEALQWIFSLPLDNVSNQVVGLVTAVLTALIALVKFIFTFAITRKPPPE